MKGYSDRKESHRSTQPLSKISGYANAQGVLVVHLAKFDRSEILDVVGLVTCLTRVPRCFL